MSMWNPWRGCQKIGDGCKYCYIHGADYKRSIDTSIIVKTNEFYKPVEKNKIGEYKLKPGTFVNMCFSTDFLLNEADEFRIEAYKIIEERSDLEFFFLTKRIERFYETLPEHKKSGYDNLTVGVSVSTQKEIDEKISFLNKMPIKNKLIILQPLIEEVSVIKYLKGIKSVTLGGEAHKLGRVLNNDWILKVRDECIKADVSFDLRQLGSNFMKDGILYQIPRRELFAQARIANLNYKSGKIK